MRTLWFRSTLRRSYYAEGQTFRPDAEGYVEIPENAVAQLDPTFVYVGIERPQKPAEPHPAVTSPAAAVPTAGDNKPAAAPATPPAGPSIVEAPPYRTGLAGKPSSWHLVEAECRRRWSAGERHIKKEMESPSEWASILLPWLVSQHPSAARPTLKTLSNRFSRLLRELISTTPR
jgi:hypothetical protein